MSNCTRRESSNNNPYVSEGLLAPSPSDLRDAWSLTSSINKLDEGSDFRAWCGSLSSPWGLVSARIVETFLVTSLFEKEGNINDVHTLKSSPLCLNYIHFLYRQTNSISLQFRHFGM